MGPWSRRRQSFEWNLDGLATREGLTDQERYALQCIRRKGEEFAKDCIFPEMREHGGAAYAPYLHDVCIRGGKTLIRYTMSTWHPYQVLMEHELSSADLVNLE